MSGGFANILNKQHNSKDCLQPPDHSFYAVVLFFREKQRRLKMKKLLTLTAVGAILSTPASAVQKCVAFNPGASCTFPDGVSYISTGPLNPWTMNCTYSGKTTAIRVIGLCSPTKPESKYQTKETIEWHPQNFTLDTPLYCWCKAISPIESHWISATTSSDTVQTCMYTCNSKCSGAKNDTGFKAGIHNTASQN